MPDTKNKMSNAERKARKAQLDMQYAREKLKRIPLDVQKSFYETIKHEADSRGESVNGFIKMAVLQRIESGR